MVFPEDQPKREGLSDSIGDLLESPFVDASAEAVAACKGENAFTALAHGLYREAGCVLSVCSCTCSATGRFNRNQAICVGLLVRIVKFMTAVAQLTFEEDRREVVYALSRCITESATNLRYLILKNDNALFDSFVKTSLGGERESFDTINANIKARGGKVLPIEKRMLEMFERLCKSSDIKIEDVQPGHRDWGVNMRHRIEALGVPEHAYVSLQRFGSHAVHGTWVDLLVHHLSESATPEGGQEFEPKTTFGAVDERSFGPIGLYVLDAGEDYLKHFFGESAELNVLYDRIDDLRTRIMRVMNADEKDLQKRRGQAHV